MVMVEMITYNHEGYIAQAIESVMMQKTSFNYKLLICEDCSTDATRVICIEYKKRFPDKIQLNLNEKNFGVSLNARKLHELSFKSNSKYIAMCDGDDYWSDEYKLEKQINLLEANDEYAISYHRVEELLLNGSCNLEALNTAVVPKIYTIEDLAIGNIIHTPSVVFRNTLLNEFPEWFAKAPVGDYVIHMLNARHGKIHYLPDVMAVYRVGVGTHGSLQIEKKLRNWEITLQYLLTMEWPGNVGTILNERLKITRHIIRRNKFKTLYKIRDTLVTITGLRLLKRILGSKTHQ